MIAQTAVQTAKPQTINIGLDEHGQIQSVGVGFQVHCRHHTFTEGVTWHDGRGVSIVRADPHWLRLLTMLVEKMIADSEARLER